MNEELQPLAELAETLLIGHYSRHVFLCTGESCSATGVGEAAWEVLKRELKEKELSLATGPDACYRTKVGCLRICRGGPILLVYPEGTYYGGMTAEQARRDVRMAELKQRLNVLTTTDMAVIVSPGQN